MVDHPVDDLRVALDGRTGIWSGGRILAGGAPWRVVRLGAAALPFVSELRRAAAMGVVPGTPLARSVAKLLLERGLAHPVRSPRPGPHPVTVVVPAFDRAAQLEM